MTLILFDIDGTLTATGDADLQCYASAFQKVFGAPLPHADWNAYKHVTDSGVIGEALEQIRGSFVTEEELTGFEEVFLAEVEAAYAADPSAFVEVPGAKAVLDVIEQTDGLAAGLATGGMRATALFKLAKIGVDGTRLPAGFANDSIYREEIARRAIALADGVPGDVVYVGDGTWDVRTARAVGMRFIGITEESCPERLRKAGASVCLKDYSDPAAFFEAVSAAEIPAA